MVLSERTDVDLHSVVAGLGQREEVAIGIPHDQHVQHPVLAPLESSKVIAGLLGLGLLPLAVGRDLPVGFGAIIIIFRAVDPPDAPVPPLHIDVIPRPSDDHQDGGDGLSQRMVARFDVIDRFGEVPDDRTFV